MAVQNYFSGWATEARLRISSPPAHIYCLKARELGTNVDGRVISPFTRH